MNDADTRRYESFLRGQEVGRANASLIPASSLATELFTRLSNIITNIQKQSDLQSSSQRAAQQSTTSKASARDEVLLDLRAIARTARGIALVTPGLEDKFRLPRNVRDQDLLSIARSSAVDAEPFKAEFIKRGLPADFLEDLNDDIAAFEQAITQQIQGTEAQVAATAALDDLIDEGIRTMRELDPVMRNLFADNPGILAQWLSASHVERAPRKKKATPPPPTPSA
jgi:hypothetical protein